jgi:hypothetical protein
MFEFLFRKNFLFYFMANRFIQYQRDVCTALLFCSFLVQLAFLDALAVCNLNLFVK